MQAHNIPLPKGDWDLANLESWVPEENREKLRMRPCAQCGKEPDLSLGEYQFKRCNACYTVYYW